MAKTYEALVLDDGRLSLAGDACHEMELKSGERVEVTINRFSGRDDLTGLDMDNPLVKMIGMCDGVEQTDLSVGHDRYLYRKDKP